MRLLRSVKTRGMYTHLEGPAAGLSAGFDSRQVDEMTHTGVTAQICGVFAGSTPAVDRDLAGRARAETAGDHR